MYKSSMPFFSIRMTRGVWHPLSGKEWLSGRENMSKQEFIDRLRTALNGRIAPNQVQENVDYYEDYINTQIRKGRSEEEVLNSLGDPRLIAKTIVETSGNSGNGAYERTDYRNTGYQDTSYYQQKKTFHMPGWLWGIIAVLVIVLIFSAVFSVLSFLAPIILPVFVVIFLVKLFRDWLN